LVKTRQISGAAAALHFFSISHLFTVHSPTLIVLAAILAALVTAVLHVVWFFNKNIPGLRLWTFSFLSAAVFCTNLLVRGYLPEVVSVVLTQCSIALSAYFCFLGSRAYLGRPPPPHRYAAVAIAALLGVSTFFTVAVPHAGARFALAGVLSGVYFVLTAVTLARGGFTRVPARYLFAGLVGFHGVFILLRPLLFRLASDAAPDERLIAMLSHYVVLEATIALVMMAFGTLMLTNEHITTELRHLAEVDPLTCVFNRRAFLTLLDKAISNAERMRQGLPVLVLDLDHFKAINDTWGHSSGDDVLRQFVLLADRCLRKEDVMGRLGGEEFAIFLPNADAPGALAVAERLRATVGGAPVDSDQQSIAMTVSIGVALCMRGDSAEAALKRADGAMYLAKQRGRNRVEMAESLLPA
jgi:diguanylate cyclase (GGDEF)-like protein